jgi:UDP:flavonoid glycosyltransferase YjiC (YdhE family)
MEYVFWRCYGRVTRFIVPDFASHGLSGELSHDLRFIPPEQMSFIGILSGVRRRQLPEDIDCYVSISGPEPQRTILERIILEQVYDLHGRVVVSLGKPDEAVRSYRRRNVTVYSYVNRRQQEDLMNRARLVISRSGYSTIMELAELGKRALLIPTPGQTEQEYLADLHLRLGNFYSVSQKHLNLPRDVEIAHDYPGYKPAHFTDQSIEKFMQLVAG